MSDAIGAPSTTLRRGTPEAAGMSASRVRHLTELGAEWVRKGAATGMVLLAARRGVIVFHEAFGRLTPDTDSPPAPLDALFPLASISKILTATALMTLVEEGRVGLNRPVSGYLPEFQGEGKDKVLVRHLLTHTSGIREEELEKYAEANSGKVDLLPADPSQHPLLNEYFAERYRCPLWKAAGEEMSYCDFNFELAGEIVRRVSQTPLDRFAHARLFQPLGMNDTYFCRVDAPRERRTRRVRIPEPVPTPLTKAMETDRLSFGSGTALSTAQDMAILGQMFLNRGAYGDARILSPASVAAMTRNQIPGVPSTFLEERFREATWGLGWSVHGSKNGLCGGLYSPASFEHWGFGGTYVWVDPENEIVGVYLSAVRDTTPDDPWTQGWMHDLFTDAVTAAVVEP